MKALFVTVDAGGNLPPELGVASELTRRGAHVQFLGHAAQRAAIERAGFGFTPYPTATTFDPLHGQGMISGLRAFLSIATDRRVGDDAVALARSERIDIVVADVIVSRGIQRLVAADIPTACLGHSFYAFAENMSRSPVGLLMRLRGLDARQVEGSTLGVLVVTRRDLDPARSVPSYAHHTGVVWQGTPVPATPSDPPTVLVSLSTVAFPGQQRTLQAVLDALARTPVQAIVTTGPAIDPGTLDPGPNTRVHAWLDHADVLPTTSLVIGHGGHSTTVRALSYGVPVLVIPSHPMLDQRLVGDAVTRAGVGSTLARGTPSARIAAEVARLLDDDVLQRTTDALGASIRQHDGAAVAADLIERWATSPST